MQQDGEGAALTRLATEAPAVILVQYVEETDRAKRRQGGCFCRRSSQFMRNAIRHVIRGHKATLEFNRTGLVITPQEAVSEDVISRAGGDQGAGGLIEYKKKGAEDITLHHWNLQAAIASRSS